MCHGQVACYTLDTYGPNIPWIPWQQQTDHKKTVDLRQQLPQ